MTDPGTHGGVDPAPLAGRPRTISVASHESRALSADWTLCAVPAGSVETPDQLAGLTPAWKPAVVPGTVALAQRAAGGLDLDHVPNYDADDWWYRCTFAAETSSGNDVRDVLCFDGLATLADVWLNGERILSSENMFLAHSVDVSALLRPANELAIRFRSLRAALDARRPRPRWRTKLVEHQQLRWHRTTLLGRMPGWSPPVRAVGPWRGVRLERRRALEVIEGDVHATAAERGGVVEAALTVRGIATEITDASLVVAGKRAELAIDRRGGDVSVRGALTLADAEHWWPHTHGAQPRYDAAVVVGTSAGPVEIALGKVAFRRVNANRADDGFSIEINDVPLFCRGACWTTPDIVALSAPDGTYRELLSLARDAGMNMLRVGGTMSYEADAFYDICDELGILVWQEFMFANMDYPANDDAFVAAVREEAEQVVARLRRHPSIAVFCGNSEVEQQAAMLGLDPELWTNAIFREVLPSQCDAGMPGVPYVPSSPTGGALPFHVDSGVAHYFGVGAYLRPIDDARRSGVRFASECLGFSNIPEQSAIDALLPNGEAPFHHPRWKSRVPRDHGAGWDFEDIRDFYLAEQFAVDPMRLRYADMDRYLALSRVVTGDVIARVVGEWRRGGSSCRGALIWFYQDLWLGAGWGAIDAAGRPKALYYALKRAMQPVALAITDEGNNGLSVHVANDRAEPLDAELRLSLLRGGATVVTTASTPLRVPGRGAASIRADAVFGRFHDTGYAFRFGPPGHDVVAASLVDAAGAEVSTAFHFPHGAPNARTDEPLISGHATRESDTTVSITLGASKFAQAVSIQAGDYLPDDNYFHMAPGTQRVIVARARRAGVRFDGFAQALNAYDGIRLPLTASAAPRTGEAQ